MTMVLLLILSCGIFGAFFFAGVETGFVSWNPLKVGYRARRGTLSARWAVYLMKHKERVIAMMLIGNNASVVAATLAFLFLYYRLDSAVYLDLAAIPSPETWFLSPVLIIFSEMLPKSLFRIYSFRLTMKSVPVLMLLYWITVPFTWILSVSGSLFQKRDRKSKAFHTNVRKEMILIAQEGSRRGTLFEYATVIVDTILNLKEKMIGDITGSNGTDTLLRRVTVSDTVASICRSDTLPDKDEFLVYNTDGVTVAGWISLLDIAKADGNTQLRNLVHPLPAIGKHTSLLAFFSKKTGLYSPFYRFIDENGTTEGIVKNISIFRVIFDGYSTI